VVLDAPYFRFVYGGPVTAVPWTAPSFTLESVEGTGLLDGIVFLRNVTHAMLYPGWVLPVHDWRDNARSSADEASDLSPYGSWQ
jgi:hypothetical protein